MTALEQIRRLWEHAVWADGKLLDALRAGAAGALAWREYAHVLGAEAVWLARLEGREATTAIWPALTPDEADALSRSVRDGYAAYLERLDDDALDRLVAYRNSAGQAFSTAIGDILLHVALHGQYHRGKINLMLRQDGLAPVPTDYIAFVRGAPAATAVRP